MFSSPSGHVCLWEKQELAFLREEAGCRVGLLCPSIDCPAEEMKVKWCSSPGPCHRRSSSRMRAEQGLRAVLPPGSHFSCAALCSGVRCSGVSWTQGSLRVLPVSERLENEEKKGKSPEGSGQSSAAGPCRTSPATQPSLPVVGFPVQGFSKRFQDQLWCLLLLFCF